MLVSTSLSTSAFGLLVGTLLVLFGMAMGYWLGGRAGASPAGDVMPRYYLARMLKSLSQWVEGFSGDLSCYRDAMDRAGQALEAVHGRSSQDSRHNTASLLAQIVQANEQVKSRLEKAETALQQQALDIASYLSEARSDALTGLANRRAFDDELARRFADARRNTHLVSLLMFDIDHFKRFNDQHGHPVGDAVLAEVARVLRDTIHGRGTIARLGGEEFAVILPSCDERDACLVAEQVRRAVEAADLSFGGKRLKVTISGGAAKARRDEAIASLVDRADKALYASKHAGRNFIHWHDGQRCVPITRRPVASPNSADSPTENRDFAKVCDELRQRLHAVLNEENSPPIEGAIGSP